MTGSHSETGALPSTSMPFSLLGEGYCLLWTVSNEAELAQKKQETLSSGSSGPHPSVRLCQPGESRNKH